MKKLFTFLILLTTTVAYAGPSVAPSFDGELRWGDGRRFVGYVAENVWTDPTTFWLTSSVNAGFTLNYEDREFVFLANGTFTIDLDAAATLGDGFSFVVKNVGVGTITIDPNGAETIDGAATLALPNQYDTAFVVTDGTAWHVITSGGSGGGFWTRDAINGYLYPSTLTDDVGIGTATPGNKLDIVTGSTTTAAVHIGEVDNEGMYITSTSDSQAIISGGVEFDAGSWRARATTASSYLLSSGNTQFFNDTGLTDGNVFTPTESMRITSNNLVGIGTKTPGTVNGVSFSTVKLHINNVTSNYLTIDNSAADGYSGILLNRAAANANQRVWVIESQPSDSNTSSSLAFSTYTDAGAPTTRMTILRDGNVGINTTTPDRKLDVLDATDPQIRATHTDDAIYSEWQTTGDGIGRFTGTGNAFLFPAGDILTGPSVMIGYTDTGFASNAQNLGFYESGKLVLDIADTTKGYRIPSDFTYEWSSATDNKSSSDTKLRRAAAGVIQSDGAFYGGNNANACELINTIPTSTQPTMVPNRTDNDTGIGHTSADQLSLIAGGVEGIRILESAGTLTVQMPHDSWLTAIDNAGTGTVNMFKVNTSDNVELGADMDVSGKLVTTADTIIPFIDVDITSAVSGTEVGYTMDVDGSNVVAVLGDSDGAGGSNGEYVKFYGGEVENVTVVNAATYDTSLSDNILHVTYTGTGAVTSLTLMTELCDETVDNGRLLTIKDAGGNAAANSITVDTEGAETIDGSGTAVISADYDSIDLYCYSSNWFIK